MIIKKPSNQGFTLIEIIISLIVFGIMAGMLVTMGQTALTRSAELVGITRNTYNLKAVMENINSDYISMINPNNMNASILDDLVSNLHIRCLRNEADGLVF
jgi:prepilin-type N-terminal cleavage/methylation domain-containing protein